MDHDTKNTAVKLANRAQVDSSPPADAPLYLQHGACRHAQHVLQVWQLNGPVPAALQMRLWRRVCLHGMHDLLTLAWTLTSHAGRWLLPQLRQVHI